MSEKQNGKNYTAMELMPIIAILFFPVLFLEIVSVVTFIGVIFLLCSFVMLGVLGLFELLAGVMLVGVSIEKLFSIPMGAFSVMGFGITNIGIAMLIECFVLWLFCVAIPEFVKKIFGKEERHEKTS